ncbi:conserved hypothetical protein [Culex quinquefasciatus]|uniref:Glycosyl hydrolases family 39 N-terminal catalytic domain-containing protein n=2 Tax=Culex quinquefasciatus TaxID=7176 RepID=B0X4Y1_CULQU|nr:conserved hypothetical protein [Culex quinquefasciatus]|eukprot:XP_001864703.1 conserved hypothetical protein [Culex quinquefasciatus]
MEKHGSFGIFTFSHYDDKKTIFYDFSKLDAFLDKLNEFGLYPAIELMGVPQGIYERESKRRFGYFWADLTMQLAARYLHRYGMKFVLDWRFETWNEPDLRGYNVLNFTTEEYISYVQSTRLGLDAAGRLFNNQLLIPLRGPAGLFKAELHHPFCWEILELCNKRPRKCPFEVLSFHRKGSGARADEILDGGLQLMDQIWERFPNLSGFKVSNDEADPIAGWSTPREFQSNVKYGAMLVSTVLQHWSAKFQGRFVNLESISHDNAFLSYHPFEFNQRTLLARFEMNETHPREVQFVAKPVYSALGMLASLGPLATDATFEKDNLSYVISYDLEPFYASILLTQSNDTFEPLKKRTALSLNITLPTLSSSSRIAYVVEGLQAGLNDPSGVWHYYGRPPYPTREQFAEMRSAQFLTPCASSSSSFVNGPWTSRVNREVVGNTTLVKFKTTIPTMTNPTITSFVRPYFEGEKFSFWEERLGYTFAAFDVTEDKVKKAHLALLGGSLLHERLKLLFPRQELDSASYEEVITRLTTHFDRPDEWGEVVHHARFHSLVQQPGQTLKQFVRVVKLEAQFCTFGSYAREAIRDRIVVGVRSDDLRNLLLADQHLTLESAERKVAIWAMLNKS